MTFDDHTTDMVARQQTLERLTTVDVPPDAQPQLQPLSTAIGEIFRYRVKGDGYTPRELRTLEDWVVDPEFARGARAWRTLTRLAGW